MRLQTYRDVAACRAAVGPFLMRDEAAHSVPLGLLNTLVLDPNRYPEAHLWSVEDPAGAVVGAAWFTPPHPVGLTTMPASCVPLVVEAAARLRTSPTQVFGPRAEADAFRDLWCATRGVAVAGATPLRMLRAERAALPFPVPGATRVAVPADRELLVEWSHAFCADCHLPSTADEVERSVDAVLKNGLRHLWQDDAGRPVAMAGTPQSATRIVRIGWVYTPPALRGRGYATALVTALTERLLAQGRQCVLYTDAANPTSNGIYERIGYRHIGDSVSYRFA